MTASPADRVRASKIRRRVSQGDVISEDDQTWFRSYEDSRRGGPGGALVDASASATERITYTEERSAAAATGDHPHPEAYAAIARSEGLRADTLLRITSDALVRCNEQYRVMFDHLLERTKAIEDAHIQMMEAVRANYLGRVEAEGAALMAQTRATIEKMSDTDDGEDDSSLAQLVAYLGQALQRQPKKRSNSRPKKPKKPLGSVE